MYVNRSAAETALTVTFPNNPVARESVLRYVAAMKAVYVRVAEGREVSSPSGRPELTRVVGG
jgi:hypothetical protein